MPPAGYRWRAPRERGAPVTSNAVAATTGADPGIDVRVRTAPDGLDVAALVTSWGVVDALSEAKVVAATNPGERAPGFLATALDGEQPLAYAQLLAGNTGWSLELALAPGPARLERPLGLALVDAALSWLAARGGGHLFMWHRTRSGDSGFLEEVARARGLVPIRRLLELEVDLPLDDERSRSAALALRPFRPGTDEDAWLRVNNRAFAAHPEQGGWDRAMLEGREAQRWFDPGGFLLYEEEGVLLGSCWTKVHDDLDPPAGEIYVISVDPDAGGRGLGRALTVAGLAWLADQGLRVGMLYVEGDNAAALGLYRSLGFEEVSVLTAYEGDVAGRPSPTS
jgi:mycothiol synthase